MLLAQRGLGEGDERVVRAVPAHLVVPLRDRQQLPPLASAVPARIRAVSLQPGPICGDALVKVCRPHAGLSHHQRCLCHRNTSRVWPPSTSRGAVHTVPFAPPREHTAMRAPPPHIPRGDHTHHPGGALTPLHVEDLDPVQPQPITSMSSNDEDRQDSLKSSSPSFSLVTFMRLLKCPMTMQSSQVRRAILPAILLPVEDLHGLESLPLS